MRQLQQRLDGLEHALTASQQQPVYLPPTPVQQPIYGVVEPFQVPSATTQQQQLGEHGTNNTNAFDSSAGQVQPLPSVSSQRQPPQLPTSKPSQNLRFVMYNP